MLLFVESSSKSMKVNKDMMKTIKNSARFPFKAIFS